MRSLIKLGLLLVVGILVYNYFMGTPEEKASSKEIFRQVGQLGKATWGLLKSEKSKLDEGKYDTALDKMDNIYTNLRSHARSNNDLETLERLAALERERQALEERMMEIDQAKDAAETRNRPLSTSVQNEDKALRVDVRQLLNQTEALMKQMDKAPY
jgi:hypothetical protein